jgi:5-methylcytosine-specific restriction endonuclease McrA
LPRFFHLSREDAKVLSVELAPREDVPVREVVTRLDRTGSSKGSAPSISELALVCPSSEPAMNSPSPVQQLNAKDPEALDRKGQAAAAIGVRPEITEPMTAQLSRLHLTVTRGLLAKIEAAQLALSHAHPNATITDLLELGVETALAQDAKRKGLVKRPRRPRVETPPVSPASDHIPAEVRRAVWERDRGCCQWKLANGELCGSGYRLQYDHIQPRAKGGKTTIANVRVLCQRHNLLAARLAYGEKLMRRYGRSRARTGTG